MADGQDTTTDPNATAFPGGQSAIGALFNAFGQWLQSDQGQAALHQPLAQTIFGQQPATQTPPGQVAPTPAQTPATAGTNPYDALGRVGQGIGGGAGPQVTLRSPTNTFDPTNPASIQTSLDTAQSQFDKANAEHDQLTKAYQDLYSQFLQLNQDPGKNFQQLQNITPLLQSMGNQLYASMGRLSQANVNLANVQVSAMDKLGLQPAQVAELNGRAQSEQKNAVYLDAQAQVLLQSAPLQQGLVVAQTAEANARARGDDAQAKVYGAQADQITQQTQQLLPAQTAQAFGAANQSNAQAALNIAQATGLTPAEAAQYLAQANLYNTQAGTLVPAQANQANAQAYNITGRTPAEIAQLGAQAFQQQTTGMGNLATIQQNLQGNLYGLQDRVNLIKQVQQMAFTPQPGKSLDQMTADANQMLEDYINASIGGTTPAAAATVAGNLAQQGYSTLGGMVNAAQAAQASRANAFQLLGGNVLGTLGQMNVNAPAGSTAGAAAFEQVMNNMAQRLQGPQFAAPQMPAAPALPAFLQRFANQYQASGGPPATAPQTSAPVTINIGGGGSAASGLQLPTPQVSYQNPGVNLSAMPGFGAGGQSTNLPNVLQGYAPATVDSLHGQWSNELASGAVTSPFQSTGG
jgi:hypothetical protein